jgi:hypothetical protein
MSTSKLGPPDYRLCHRRRPSALLRTAPDGIFDLDSDCASVRKKEGTWWVRRAAPVVLRAQLDRARVRFTIANYVI